MLLLDDFPATGRRVQTARQQAAQARSELAAAEAELRARFGVVGRQEATDMAEELLTRMMRIAEQYIEAMKDLHKHYPVTK